MAEHPYYTGIESKLSSVASGRVYADQLPDSPTYPAVRVAILTDMPHQRLRSGDNITADVQIDVYERRGGSADAWTVDQAVRDAMDRQDITVAGFSKVHSMCTERGRPFKEAGYYRIVSQYKLFGTAA